MKTAVLKTKVTPEYQATIKRRAQNEGVSVSDYIRICLDDKHEKSTQQDPTKDPNGDTTGTHQVPKDPQAISIIIDQITQKDEQMAKKDEQIAKLQESLDQSQQLQAMTEKRYEVEHQQLIEMKARSFWQKLTSVFE